MLTVFGHFEEDSSGVVCVEAEASAGEFGGNVTYVPCLSTSSVTVLVKPFTSKLLGCINSESVIADPNVTVTIIQPCGGSGGSNLDNVYTVERQSDGFSTYAQLNSSYSVNNQVRLSNDGLQCYDIMGTAYVGNPAIYDTITALCSGGGSKGDDVITPF